MSTAPSTSDPDATQLPGKADEDTLGTRAEIENLGPCKLKVTAVVPVEKVQELLDRNYKDLISSLSLPGFRQGRVPRALVEKRYGEEVEKDLKEALLNDSFTEVIEDKKLDIVGQPTFGDVEFKKGEDFRYEVTFEIAPEFEIEKYKGLEVEKKLPEVTDEMVQEELDRLLQSAGTMAPIELSEAKEGDLIFATVEYFEGGESVSDGPGSGMFRHGDTSLNGIPVPGLEEKVKTLAENPEFEIENVQIPEGYVEEEIRGKVVTVKIKVEDAKTEKPAELDEEFLKRFEVETEDELRQQLRESLEARAEQDAQNQMEQDLVDQLEASVEFDVPGDILAGIRDSGKARARMQLVQAGKTDEEVEEELAKLETEESEENLRKNLKKHFILEEIAHKERIFVTEDEIKNRILGMAQMYGISPDQLAQQMIQAGQMDQMRTDLRQEKVRTFLREKAKILGDDTGGKSDAPAESDSETGTESTAEES